MAAGQGNVGRKVILTWDAQQIPGVREKSAAINGEPIDVSADDSNGWRELLDDPSEQMVDVSLSGVTKSGLLRTASFNSTGRIKAVTITYPDGGVISGDFYLASYTDTKPYKDAMTFEATLQSTGPVTYTPGP